jgi:aerobic carbon-monoxide dehydrogenase medium subunit
MVEPEFVRAASVDEAIAAIGRAPSDSVIVAGGVVVGSLINQRLVSPAILVDISRIHSLRGIERMPDGGVRIGALVTHEEMRRSCALATLAPLLVHIAAEIACPRLRNRGTLGGSVCTIGGQGDPATGLLTLGAHLSLRGPKGARSLALEDFYKDAFDVDLRSGELLESVDVPPMPTGASFGFCKLGPRKAMDWTQITASVVLRRGGDNGFDHVRIGLNGVGPTPSRPRKAEEAVRQHGQHSHWSALTASLDEDIEPSSDLVYSAAHKRRLAAVALQRAIDGALASLAQNGVA